MAKTKALISFAVTAKLICVFVFTYAKIRVFSRRGSNNVHDLESKLRGPATVNQAILPSCHAENSTHLLANEFLSEKFSSFKHVGNIIQWPHSHISLLRLVRLCWHSITRNMSRLKKKPTFGICEDKDTDQLGSNREADQRICFRYLDSPIPLLPKSKTSSLWPSPVAVQPGLCRTRSESTLLVFSCCGSYKTLSVYRCYCRRFELLSRK